MERTDKTRSRITVLRELIQLDGDIACIENELKAFPWDVDAPLLIVTRADIIRVLDASLQGAIDLNELEQWANVVECRDDIDYEQQELQDAVFMLANPVLHGAITRESLIALKSNLVDM